MKKSTNSSDSNLVNIEEILIKSGLSENEAKVFLALLSLGRGTVSKITRKAGLNRTTGYDILDSLVAKGLVSVSGKEPRQEFVAESPDKMVTLLQNNLAQAEKNFSEVQKIIPELKSMHNVSGRPKVSFYEGESGLKQVYEDTLTSNEEILAYAAVDDMHQALPNYFPKYYERRAGKNISIRAIIPATDIGKNRAEKDASEKRTSVLIPPDKYYFTPEINIYDDKIMIASWREKLGVIIESAEIADIMKKIYELAWIGAKEESKKI
jgi:sugar-specific transcriptional regulator TrmB